MSNSIFTVDNSSLFEVYIRGVAIQPNTHDLELAGENISVLIVFLSCRV